MHRARWLRRAPPMKRGERTYPVGRVSDSAGPSEPQWVRITNTTAVELSRTRQGSTVVSHKIQESHAGHAFQQIRARRQFSSGTKRPELLVSALDENISVLLAAATAFHLGAVSEANAADVDQQVIGDIAPLALQVVLDLNTAGRSVLSSLVPHEKRVLWTQMLLLAAAHVATGIRHWELMSHHEPLVGLDQQVRAWDSSRVWADIHTPESLMLFGFPLGGQRRLLLMIPVCLTAVCAEQTNELCLCWSDRLALAAAGSTLALVDDLVHSGACTNASSLQKLTLCKLGILHEADCLNEKKPSSSSSCSHRAASASSMPLWGFALLSPLLAASLINACSASHSLSTNRPFSQLLANGAAKMATPLRIGQLVIPIRFLYLRHQVASVSSSDKARGIDAVQLFSRQRHSHVQRTVDNTSFEWAVLIRDLLSVSHASAQECFSALTALKGRSLRQLSDARSAALLAALLRQTAMRLALLLQRHADRAVTAGVASRNRRPSKAKDAFPDKAKQDYERDLLLFQNAYPIVGEILMRLSMADDDIPPIYWEVVRRLLD